MYAGDNSSKLCRTFNEFACAQKVYNVASYIGTELLKHCDCLPSCNTIDYNVKVDFVKFKQMDYNDYTPGVMRASMSIYFADEEFITYRRYASLGTVTLLSNIGGLLGLFLGVSALSIIEVFYFFVVRLVNNLWI